jgi:hypothetical protein
MNTGVLEQALQSELERHGYYPQLVFQALDSALGREELLAYVVHQEATFERDELRRHMSVLALTRSRLIVSHTDEHNHEGESYASTSNESIRLRSIDTVVLNRVVKDPLGPGGPVVSEVVLTVGWGAVSRIELEPASCGDPECDAEHGYVGTTTNDDFSLRVSQAADGDTTVVQVLEFADTLSQASVSVQN